MHLHTNSIITSVVTEVPPCVQYKKFPDGNQLLICRALAGTKDTFLRNRWGKGFFQISKSLVNPLGDLEGLSQDNLKQLFLENFTNVTLRGDIRQSNAEGNKYMSFYEITEEEPEFSIMQTIEGIEAGRYVILSEAQSSSICGFREDNNFLYIVRNE